MHKLSITAESTNDRRLSAAGVLPSDDIKDRRIIYFRSLLQNAKYNIVSKYFIELNLEDIIELHIKKNIEKHVCFY